MVTLTLIVFGGAGMLGSISFSKFYMANRRRFIFVTTAAPTLCLLLLLAASVNVWLTMLLCVVWGAMATAFNIAFQDNTIRFAPENATSIGMSIFSGLFNLGIGCGAYVGGLVVSHASLSDIGYAGGLIGVLMTVYCVARFFPNMRKREARR